MDVLRSRIGEVLRGVSLLEAFSRQRRCALQRLFCEFGEGGCCFFFSSVVLGLMAASRVEICRVRQEYGLVVEVIHRIFGFSLWANDRSKEITFLYRFMLFYFQSTSPSSSSSLFAESDFYSGSSFG